MVAQSLNNEYVTSPFINVVRNKNLEADIIVGAKGEEK
jgi:hypothetical protein